MTIAATSLPNDVNVLQQLVLEYMALREISEREIIKSEQEKIQLLQKKDKRIEQLEQVIHYLKMKQYGRSSERHLGDSPQEEIVFNEAEQLTDASTPEDATATSETQVSQPSEESPTTESTAKKSTRGRRALPEHLRREKIYHDLSAQQQQCPCGCQMSFIDEVISEQLAIIPAELYVIQHCRKKYVCKTCTDKPPVTAPLPAQPLPKSNASPELLAHIAISKFLDGLPFYRQEKIWERLNIQLTRATQANWMIGCGNLVQPLMNLLVDYHAQGNLIHIDETTVQVLNEKDKSPQSKKYLWLAMGGPPDKQVFRYHYHPSRGSEVALDLLSGFTGTLMSDDWSVYGKVCEKLHLTHIACNDHARRKFKEAEKELPKHRKSGSVSKPEMALHYYQKLYAVERKIKEMSADEKFKVRQQEAVPLWQTFIAWMEKHIHYVTPESTFGKALHYTYKLKDKLSHYCTDGNLPISNQLAENAIRPFAIARKNFLFYDTPEGATASANLYSLMMTAKHHGLNPYHYLTRVFKCLPQAQTLEDVEALLPWALSQNVNNRLEV